MAFLRVTYDEGDVYEGEWSADGKRNGPGRLELKSGVVYAGEFQNGLFHGSGVLTLPDGSKYEGHFEVGKFHGYGVYTNQDGMKFEVRMSSGNCILPISYCNDSRVSFRRVVLVDWESSHFLMAVTDSLLVRDAFRGVHVWNESLQGKHQNLPGKQQP